METNGDSLILTLMQAESELRKDFNLSDSKDQERMGTFLRLKLEAENKLQKGIREIVNHQDTLRSFLENKRVHVLSPQKDTSLTKATYYVKSDLFTSINDLNHDCFYYIRMANTDDDDISNLSEFPKISKLSMLKSGDYFLTPLTTGKNLYTIIGNVEFSNEALFDLIKGLDSLIEASFKESPTKIAIFFNFELSTTSYEIKRIFLNLILIILLTKMIYYLRDNLHPVVTFLLSNEQEQDLFQKILSSYQRKEISQRMRVGNFNVKLNEICNKCLTRDPKYIEILKSILYIVDEDDIPILLLGESGVGKSYLAKTIHEISNREKDKYEQINCGILGGEKMYQQIWGWEKGSFTGAVNKYDGLLKRADRGTFFVDEIDRASIEVRNALLTFVENKTYERLGGEKKEKADVRLIFGSNKNLKKYIQKGLFEQDLYARIAGRIVNIPPLRERREDIDLLVDYFLSSLNDQKQSYVTIDNNARNHLKSYSWPLNIRELQQYIKLVFYEVNAEKEKVIRKEHLEKYPFDDLLNLRLEDFDELIGILKSFLITWDKKDGKFLEEIIFPIVAKIYKDDYSAKFTKEEVWNSANDIIGLSGLNHNSSSLMKYYKEFENIKDKLKLN